jgi:hypothetical protein
MNARWLPSQRRELSVARVPTTSGEAPNAPHRRRSLMTTDGVRSSAGVSGRPSLRLPSSVATDVSETVAKSTGSMPRSLDRTLHPG